MTSAQRGKWDLSKKRADSTDGLRECDSDKGEGRSKIPKNLQASYVNGP